jgi:hypothetical protein
MWDLWWTKWHLTGLSPSTSVSPYQLLPPVLYYMKKKKKKIIVFITGCTISLKAAVHP